MEQTNRISPDGLSECPTGHAGALSSIGDPRTLIEGQPANEKVLTPEGWKPLHTLRAGDRVVGVGGKSVKVLGVTNQGRAAVYELTLSDGSMVRAAIGQRFDVVKKGGTRKNLAVAEIASEHIYTTPSGQTNYRFAIEGVDVTTKRKKGLPLHPYVVGALLGDGSCGGMCRTGKSQNRFGLSSADPFIVEEVNRLCPPGSHLKHINHYFYRFLMCVEGTYKKKSPIRLAVEAAGIWGLIGEAKHIPAEYLKHGGIDLLRGLLDTDGCADKRGHASFANSSPDLIRDVQALVRSIGGRASITAPDKRDGGGRLTIKTPLNPFALPRKVERWENARTKKGVHNTNRSIKKVVLIGLRDTIALEVDKGVYISGDYVKTAGSNTQGLNNDTK